MSKQLPPASRCPRFALGAGLLAAGCLGLPAAAQSPIDLPDEVAIGTEMETATGPVKGYTATRSATATKTDTASTETPRSISVVTAQRLEDQGRQTVQDALRHASGARSEAHRQGARGDRP